MNRHPFLLLGFLPLLAGFDLLSRPNPAISAGNRELKQGQAEAALLHYERARAEGLGEPGVELNRGLALSALGRNDEAAQAFLQASRARDTATRARAFYNLGNSLARTEKWAEAVEAYKRALMLDARNRDAKWNLELALRKQRAQESREQKSQDGNDKNDDSQGNPSQHEDRQKRGQDDGSSPKNDGKSEPSEPDEPKQPPDGRNPNAPDERRAPAPSESPPRDPGENEPQSNAAVEQSQAADEKTPRPERVPLNLQQLEAILENLEKSPKDLERARALQRAVRRRPPAKDW